MVLERIKQANDIKKIDADNLPILAQEIRDFLIHSISITGGHLASNLGVVELTMALHRVFNLPEDKIIWDVGHQSYTHKILTGRREGFEALRMYGGLSGFPKRKESDCDAFDTGHSSTSISAGLGYVRAAEIQNQDYHVISVIGDGSLTGGMAYEALNNAASLHKNFIIVLNDNNMSISENVGGMSRYLNSIRTTNMYANLKRGVEKTLRRIPVGGEHIVDHIRKTKSGIKQLLIPGMFFEDMGITYLGPVDGHNLKELERVLNEAKRVKGAVLVHVNTIKGYGYEPAEKDPSKFHGTGPYDIPTGQPVSKKDGDTYTDVFAKVLRNIGTKDEKVVAITAAMPDGTGLSLFKKAFPKRFFDVGIAEEHAVTFAAGLAAGGLKPVFAVYSSFLQRGYDQMIHDVCLQKLPVVFAIDRAGLVGSDGETHQGLFDLSYLNTIPNMTVMAPKNKWELADMLRFAVDYDGPIALRYPRGRADTILEEHREPIVYGHSEMICGESDIAIVSVGHIMTEALKVRNILKEQGYECSLVNARFVKPVDIQMIRDLSKNHRLIVTIEENALSGGYGECIAQYIAEHDMNMGIINFGLPDDYVEHGNVNILRKAVGLYPENMAQKIIDKIRGLA